MTEMKSRIRSVSTFLALRCYGLCWRRLRARFPLGTKITVVTDQSVSSKTAKAGETVTASVAHDVISDGKVVIPRDRRSS